MPSRSSDVVTGGLAPDALSQVLQDLRLSGVSYGRCELTRPWGLYLPSQGPARFHFIAKGAAWMQVRSQDWTHLHAGDALVLPRGTAHALADRPHGATKPIDGFPLEEIGENTYRLRAGGRGMESLLFCCSVSFEEPSLHPLLQLMPEVLLVRGAATHDASLPALLEAMREEVIAERVGAATVLTRLADVVITRIVRAWVESRGEDATGWLAAIRDPRIGRALAAIHRHPGDSWSVEALANVANISRSMFSERFTSVIGMPAGQYVTRWRMHLASRWLRHDRITVAEAAARLGYESEASFSRAFKRLLGFPPSALRRSDLRQRGPQTRTGVMRG
jgi:AraC-like DNA-binding protein